MLQRKVDDEKRVSSGGLAHFVAYRSRLDQALDGADWVAVERLACALHHCWVADKRVFICGNGGSAGNAAHLANDLLYGIAGDDGIGMRVEALSANSSVLTCLANDIGYEDVYSHQLAVQGRPGDLLLVLSGSGNSPNVIKALETAKGRGINTFAILGYSGGKCKDIADVPIHFAIDDMQVAEDMQLIVGHMVVQWLRETWVCAAALSHVNAHELSSGV